MTFACLCVIVPFSVMLASMCACRECVAARAWKMGRENGATLVGVLWIIYEMSGAQLIDFTSGLFHASSLPH